MTYHIPNPPSPLYFPHIITQTMPHPITYTLSILTTLLILTFLLFYFLGVFDILHDLSKRAARQKRAKTQKRPEEIELTVHPDARKLMRERKRREEVERKRLNDVRRSQGFYGELGEGYARS